MTKKWFTFPLLNLFIVTTPLVGVVSCSGKLSITNSDKLDSFNDVNRQKEKEKAEQAAKKKAEQAVKKKAEQETKEIAKQVAKEIAKQVAKEKAEAEKEKYGFDEADDYDGVIQEEKVNDDSVTQELVMKDYSNNETYFHLKNSKEVYGVDISYQNLNSIKSFSIKSLFGSGDKINLAGFKQLGRRIKNHLYHGPEIEELAGIVFIKSQPSKGSFGQILGDYNRDTKVIRIFIDEFKDSWKNKSLSKINWIKIKIDYLMSLIIHEYGHHIMWTYANNTEVSNGSRRWNNNFYKSFKKALHYDKSIFKHYPGEFGISKHNTKYPTHIGNNFTAKELFDIANNPIKNLRKWNTKKWFSYFAFGLYNRQGKYIKGYSKFGDADYRSFFGKGISTPFYFFDPLYIYTMPELATRKMWLLMYHSPIFINGKKGLNIIPAAGGGLLSPYLPTLREFIKNYIMIKTPKGWSFYKDSFLKKKLLIMEDSAWGGSQAIVDKNGKVTFKNQVSTAEDLYKAYEKVMGFRIDENNSGGSAINHIYRESQNSEYFKIMGRTSSGDHLIDLDKTLKISGFIPEEYKESKFLKGLVVKSKPYLFKKITSFLTHKNSLFDRAEKRPKDSYATIENIDLNELEKKTQIFWWFDNNDNNILDNGEQVAMKAKNISKSQNLNTRFTYYSHEGSSGLKFMYSKYSKIITDKKNVYLINAIINFITF